MSINTTISSNYPKYENNHMVVWLKGNNSNTIIINEKSTDNITVISIIAISLMIHGSILAATNGGGQHKSVDAILNYLG